MFSDDSMTNITISMIPIFALFVILMIYAAHRKSKESKHSSSSSEANAIIEAQAMLLKMQKEKEQKSGEKKEDEPKTVEKTENIDKKEKDSSKKKEDQVLEFPDDQAEDVVLDKVDYKLKPVAESPIKDTTELEPDIDKSEDK